MSNQHSHINVIACCSLAPHAPFDLPTIMAKKAAASTDKKAADKKGKGKAPTDDGESKVRHQHLIAGMKVVTRTWSYVG